MRLTFVGQRTYFEPCSLQDPVGDVVPAWVDLRPSEPPEVLRAAVEATEPDVVIAFRPDLVPAGALAGIDAARIGWLTEPLPRPGDDDPHPDLLARRATLEDLDPSQWDRVVCFDALCADTAAQVVPIWRSVPLPVSDRLYAPVREPRGGDVRFLFVGRSTPHREAFLGPVKHDFDCVHLAHGVTGERLQALMAEADVAINLHNEPYPTFENRVQTSMAAGLLVVSEPLSPPCGLNPGVDHIEVAAPWELWEVARRLQRTPQAMRSIRLAGRRQAERFRASRVHVGLAREVLRERVSSRA
jgi:hypothetical protein